MCCMISKNLQDWNFDQKKNWFDELTISWLDDLMIWW